MTTLIFRSIRCLRIDVFLVPADLAVLGTLVFAGPTRESIDVMVPDCIVPPASGSVRVDLRHHVSLSLGPELDMANWVPEPNMEKALCPSSLADTLGLQRREYWEELNPILKQWKSVNNSRCPECDRLIKVNMGRHIRLMHTTYVCFWRCPVMSCSLWFTSELNTKDHIEGVHKFQEDHGTSFYECHSFYEWFGSRTFFETRRQTSQAIWMDLALARRSGQELRNLYIVTKSPEHAPLRRFFKAAVDQLQILFDASLVTSVQPKSFLVQMREAVADCDDGSSDGSLMLLSPPRDIPEAELPAGSSMEMETRDMDSPVVITRRVTPANRPLQHLEAGRLGASTPQNVMSRPAADRHNILAVANRDVRVTRQNLAELQLYVDDHAAHLANCASADDDSIALMSAELLPRLEGGGGGGGSELL